MQKYLYLFELENGGNRLKRLMKKDGLRIIETD
jgi:hypothetical protein